MTQSIAVKQRIQSIDVLRGIVMVIMALDHVRDYFHATAFTDDPLNAQTTDPALYFTRWITHLCAPSFVFLAGTSIYLISLRKTKKELSQFLLKRGLWLMLIEVTIVTLAWTFNPLYNLLIFQVIWAIGASMVLMAILIHIPWRWLLLLGLIIVFGHNLLDQFENDPNKPIGFLWTLLHRGNFAFYSLDANHFMIIVYAIIPWTGIMVLGYCMGKLFEPGTDPVYRRRVLISTGTGLLLLFLILRIPNLYGDPLPWKNQPGVAADIYNFFNVQKYPPSLQFFCITIGIALLSLVALEPVSNRITRFFAIFGRVPFYYYVLHLYLIHLIELIFFFAAGYTAKDIVSPNTPFLFRPQHFGYSLPIVYLVWIVVIVLLYPLCRWYDRYKASHKQWWLSYL